MNKQESSGKKLLETRVTRNSDGTLKLTRLRRENTRKVSTRKKNRIYDVEKILGKKLINSHPHYLVKWLGYTRAYNTYEPIENMSGAIKLVEEYEKNLSSKKYFIIKKKKQVRQQLSRRNLKSDAIRKSSYYKRQSEKNAEQHAAKFTRSKVNMSSAENISTEKKLGGEEDVPVLTNTPAASYGGPVKIPAAERMELSTDRTEDEESEESSPLVARSRPCKIYNKKIRKYRMENFIVKQEQSSLKGSYCEVSKPENKLEFFAEEKQAKNLNKTEKISEEEANRPHDTDRIEEEGKNASCEEFSKAETFKLNSPPPGVKGNNLYGDQELDEINENDRNIDISSTKNSSGEKRNDDHLEGLSNEGDSMKKILDFSEGGHEEEVAPHSEARLAWENHYKNIFIPGCSKYLGNFQEGDQVKSVMKLNYHEETDTFFALVSWQKRVLETISPSNSFVTMDELRAKDPQSLIEFFLSALKRKHYSKKRENKSY